jgi:hypothetical protein
MDADVLYVEVSPTSFQVGTRLVFFDASVGISNEPMVSKVAVQDARVAPETKDHVGHFYNQFGIAGD